jgi:hypothetical protein
LLVADTLHTLPPPKDGTLHLIPDTTRKEKTGEQQPLAYTTKTGKFEPYLFGHTVLLLIASWGRFRIPVAVRVLNPQIRGHQNKLVREMLRKFKPPAWCQQVIVEADAGFAAKQTLQLITALGYFYVFALPRTWKLVNGTHLSDLARHLPKKLYRRVASSKPDGRRRDYWTFRKCAQLSVLGDVTLVLSKRRFNDPPHKIKLLVSESPGGEHRRGPLSLRPTLDGGSDLQRAKIRLAPGADASEEGGTAHPAQRRLAGHGLLALAGLLRIGVRARARREPVRLEATLPGGGLPGAI